jgi:hypothetical protein
MGRRIRIWKPGASYHVTLQCIDRMFLLKPSDEVIRIIGASLGRAFSRHPVMFHSATTGTRNRHCKTWMTPPGATAPRASGDLVRRLCVGEAAIGADKRAGEHARRRRTRRTDRAGLFLHGSARNTVSWAIQRARDQRRHHRRRRARISILRVCKSSRRPPRLGCTVQE